MMRASTGRSRVGACLGIHWMRAPTPAGAPAVSRGRTASDTCPPFERCHWVSAGRRREHAVAYFRPRWDPERHRAGGARVGAHGRGPPGGRTTRGDGAGEPRRVSADAGCTARVLGARAGGARRLRELSRVRHRPGRRHDGEPRQHLVGQRAPARGRARMPRPGRARPPRAPRVARGRRRHSQLDARQHLLDARAGRPAEPAHPVVRGRALPAALPSALHRPGALRARAGAAAPSQPLARRGRCCRAPAGRPPLLRARRPPGRRPAGSTAAVATNLAYPLAEMLPLAFAVGMLAISGSRPGRALGLIRTANRGGTRADGGRDGRENRAADQGSPAPNARHADHGGSPTEIADDVYREAGTSSPVASAPASARTPSTSCARLRGFTR